MKITNYTPSPQPFSGLRTAAYTATT